MLLELVMHLGCKEEKPIIYSERIAILPDKSGLLIKEVRSLDKTRNELVIKEVIGSSVKELFLFPLTVSPDVKFKFMLLHDTLYLVHSQLGFEDALKTLNQPAFPVRFGFMPPAKWLATGTVEGDPIFYAQDKWGAYLDMLRTP